MPVDVETVVIGAGVVGLAIAAELASEGRDVLVVERNHTFGTETSSRNSEVIHAGLYYPERSLKAKLCVEGRKRLYAFAEEYKVPVNRCGKLLVATTEAEIDQLTAIEAKGSKNGVDDLERLTREHAHRLEPDIRCVAATLSPSTGVIDSHLFMAALDARLLDAGGQIAFSSEVVGISRLTEIGFQLSILSGGDVSDLSCACLVNAAGLGASRVGRMMEYCKSDYVVPGLFPAKGHYFALSTRAPFKHLIYPMPSADALGVHVTLDTSGAVSSVPISTGRSRSTIHSSMPTHGGRSSRKRSSAIGLSCQKTPLCRHTPESGRRSILRECRLPTLPFTAKYSMACPASLRSTVSKAPV